MKLGNFKIKNYRSINECNANFDRYLVLVGKNNQGKTNVLRALKLAFDMMNNNVRIRRNLRLRTIRGYDYDWSKDFPINKQGTDEKETIIELTFELSDEDDDLFDCKEIVVKCSLGEDRPCVEVYTNGNLASDKEKCLDYILGKISYNYIPAIRNEELVENILKDEIRTCLANLVDDEKYIELKNELITFQKDALAKISKNITEMLRDFVPDLDSFDIALSNEYERNILSNNSFDAYINDGIRTPIENKGDGIISLIVLGLLKNKGKINSIIAIDEPEGHLHPTAIHKLVSLLNDVSKNNQVIIATHNPLLVRRNNLDQNMIVDNGEIRFPINIKDIRNILGVLVDDNLINTNKVIVVEGKTDAISLKHILSLKNERIKKAFETDEISFVYLNGVSKLERQLQQLKGAICSYVVILDNDQDGRKSFDECKKEGLISNKNARFTMCNSKEAEFENNINPNVYKDHLKDKYSFNGKIHINDKWSKAVKESLGKSAIYLNDEDIKELKTYISNNLPNNLDDIILPNQKGIIDGFEQAVLDLLDNNEMD